MAGRRLLASLLAVAIAAACIGWVIARLIPGPALHGFSRPRGNPLPGPLHGIARVVDGDTIELAGRKIRMFGIDAPERAQTCRRDGASYACGQDATAALRALAAAALTCHPRGLDRYGRIIAVCHQVGGRDINAAMVAGGWALAYRRYARDYVDLEDAARRAGQGMWSGQFDRPEDWRRQHRLQ